MKHAYTVEVRRSGRWWAIAVPELKGVFSQARRLVDVEPMARDAISAVLDVSPRSFDITMRPMLGDRLDKLAREARESRAAAQEAQVEASDRSVRALRSLQKAGIPLRDAGELLGMSHQRAAQLADADLRPLRAVRRKAIAELRRGYDLGGGPLSRRDEVYER
jgi:predicted RNase H-like HicB family nuclease